MVSELDVERIALCLNAHKLGIDQEVVRPAGDDHLMGTPQFRGEIECFGFRLFRIGSARTLENSLLTSLPLLKGMRQLVGEQPPTAGSTWGIPSVPKHQVCADRVCPGLNSAGRLSGIRVSVHPHGSEIMAKVTFEEGARSGIERLPRRIQHIVDDLGSGVDSDRSAAAHAPMDERYDG